MDDDITMPTARLTLEYGLTATGERVMVGEWDNLTDPDSEVDMITRAGMLTMAQQSLTAEAMGIDEEPEA